MGRRTQIQIKKIFRASSNILEIHYGPVLHCFCISYCGYFQQNVLIPWKKKKDMQEKFKSNEGKRNLQERCSLRVQSIFPNGPVWISNEKASAILILEILLNDPSIQECIRSISGNSHTLSHPKFCVPYIIKFPTYMPKALEDMELLQIVSNLSVHCAISYLKILVLCK